VTVIGSSPTTKKWISLNMRLCPTNDWSFDTQFESFFFFWWGGGRAKKLVVCGLAHREHMEYNV
jgi:hypothetical protein